MNNVIATITLLVKFASSTNVVPTKAPRQKPESCEEAMMQ